MNSTTDANKLRAWAKAGLRFVVPTACFALVGMVFLTWDSCPELLLAPIAGGAATLGLWFRTTVSDGPTLGTRLAEVLLWALAMQYLWLPYWTVVWKRPLTRSLRTLMMLAACFVVATLNSLALYFIGIGFGTM